MASFESTFLIPSIYRPFSKQWLYSERMMIDRAGLMPRLFPTPEHQNVVISVTDRGSTKPFNALIANVLPDLHLHGAATQAQCFPLYWYEKVEVKESEAPQPAQTAMFATEKPQDMPDEHGYVRREAITDWALQAFQKRYDDSKITKEDIFSYVYGILHSPEYKARFAADLKKMLPRIPYAADFWAFSDAGRKLGALHLNYETVEPYPLVEEKNGFDFDKPSFYRVQKMVFGKSGGKPDKSVIVYNGNLTLRGIPLEVYQHQVCDKSAIEWIMERYATTKDKDSGITNDANQWSDDPLYIVGLLKRVVTVSLQTVKIVRGLPGLGV